MAEPRRPPRPKNKASPKSRKTAELYKSSHNIGNRTAAERVGSYKETEVALVYPEGFWDAVTKPTSCDESEDDDSDSMSDSSAARSRKDQTPTAKENGISKPKVSEGVNGTANKTKSPQRTSSKSKSPPRPRNKSKSPPRAGSKSKSPQRPKVSNNKNTKNVIKTYSKSQPLAPAKKPGLKLNLDCKEEKDDKKKIKKNGPKIKQEKKDTKVKKADKPANGNKNSPKEKPTQKVKKKKTNIRPRAPRIKRTACLNAAAIVNLLYETDEPAAKKQKVEPSTPDEIFDFTSDDSNSLPDLEKTRKRLKEVKKETKNETKETKSEMGKRKRQPVLYMEAESSTSSESDEESEDEKEKKKKEEDIPLWPPPKRMASLNAQAIWTASSTPWRRVKTEKTGRSSSHSKEAKDEAKESKEAKDGKEAAKVKDTAKVTEGKDKVDGSNGPEGEGQRQPKEETIVEKSPAAKEADTKKVNGEVVLPPPATQPARVPPNGTAPTMSNQPHTAYHRNLPQTCYQMGMSTQQHRPPSPDIQIISAQMPQPGSRQFPYPPPSPDVQIIEVKSPPRPPYPPQQHQQQLQQQRPHFYGSNQRAGTQYSHNQSYGHGGYNNRQQAPYNQHQSSQQSYQGYYGGHQGYQQRSYTGADMGTHKAGSGGPLPSIQQLAESQSMSLVDPLQQMSPASSNDALSPSGQLQPQPPPQPSLRPHPSPLPKPHYNTGEDLPCGPGVAPYKGYSDMGPPSSQTGGHGYSYPGYPTHIGAGGGGGPAGNQCAGFPFSGMETMNSYHSMSCQRPSRRSAFSVPSFNQHQFGYYGQNMLGQMSETCCAPPPFSYHVHQQQVKVLVHNPSLSIHTTNFSGPVKIGVQERMEANFESNAPSIMSPGLTALGNMPSHKDGAHYDPGTKGGNGEVIKLHSGSIRADGPLNLVIDMTRETMPNGQHHNPLSSPGSRKSERLANSNTRPEKPPAGQAPQSDPPPAVPQPPVTKRDCGVGTSSDCLSSPVPVPVNQPQPDTTTDKPEPKTTKRTPSCEDQVVNKETSAKELEKLPPQPEPERPLSTKSEPPMGTKPEPGPECPLSAKHERPASAKPEPTSTETSSTKHEDTAGLKPLSVDKVDDKTKVEEPPPVDIKTCAGTKTEQNVVSKVEKASPTKAESLQSSQFMGSLASAKIESGQKAKVETPSESTKQESNLQDTKEECKTVTKTEVLAAKVEDTSSPKVERPTTLELEKCCQGEAEPEVHSGLEEVASKSLASTSTVSETDSQTAVPSDQNSGQSKNFERGDSVLAGAGSPHPRTTRTVSPPPLLGELSIDTSSPVDDSECLWPARQYKSPTQGVRRAASKERDLPPKRPRLEAGKRRAKSLDRDTPSKSSKVSAEKPRQRSKSKERETIPRIVVDRCKPVRSATPRSCRSPGEKSTVSPSSRAASTASPKAVRCGTPGTKSPKAAAAGARNTRSPTGLTTSPKVTARSPTLGGSSSRPLRTPPSSPTSRARSPAQGTPTRGVRSPTPSTASPRGQRTSPLGSPTSRTVRSPPGKLSAEKRKSPLLDARKVLRVVGDSKEMKVDKAPSCRSPPLRKEKIAGDKGNPKPRAADKVEAAKQKKDDNKAKKEESAKSKKDAPKTSMKKDDSKQKGEGTKNKKEESRGKKDDPKHPKKDDTKAKTSKSPTIPRMWCWEGEPFMKAIFTGADTPMEERKCYPAVRHITDGDVVQVRDCVLVSSGPRKTDIPYVAKIAALWEAPDTADMMMSVLWYYRPGHTESEKLPRHIPCEIFASKHRDQTGVACIDDKCHVLTFNEYCRYRADQKRVELGMSPRPKVVPDVEDDAPPKRQRMPGYDANPETVFLCRRVYDVKLKRVLKNPTPS